MALAARDLVLMPTKGAIISTETAQNLEEDVNGTDSVPVIKGRSYRNDWDRTEAHLIDKNSFKKLRQRYQLKIWRKYIKKGRCRCLDENTCKCCVKPNGFEKGCFRMRRLPGQSKIRFRLRYAGKTVMEKKIKVKSKDKYCKTLPEPFYHLRVCVSTTGEEEVEGGVKLCLLVEANRRVNFNACLVQRKGTPTTIQL